MTKVTRMRRRKFQKQYDLDMLKVSGKIADMSDIRPYNLMQG